jgi:hypothetical protein
MTNDRCKKCFSFEDAAMKRGWTGNSDEDDKGLDSQSWAIKEIDHLRSKVTSLECGPDFHFILMSERSRGLRLENENNLLKGEIASLKEAIDSSEKINSELGLLLKREYEKNELLKERLANIGKMEVDRWKDGWKAAERKIINWLRIESSEEKNLKIQDLLSSIANNIMQDKHKEDAE